ncbi:MAG: helix-turn-helix domain-containing protein [Marinifilaceae bacterium]|jgi:AraC family transcriptional activator of pobA|nr:helix-turn-helix domain-containing protein [Marinifilaceae bacterium]
MQEIKFNKTECGVDFLLNVIHKNHKDYPIDGGTFKADFFQIVFINKGNGVINLNGRKISFKENMLIFVNQNQSYQWILNDNEYEICFLVFQEGFLNDFFSDQFFSYRLQFFYQTSFETKLDLDKELFDEFYAKILEINQDITLNKNDSIHFIRSILYYLLIKLNRIYSAFNNINCFNNKDNMSLNFRKLVEENIKKFHKVEDYANLLGISRISLNKTVKTQFNMNATKFIKSRLLYEIKNLLIYSNKTIDEIAFELNFSEPNHLSRFFKKYTGMTPSIFKKEAQL